MLTLLRELQVSTKPSTFHEFTSEKSMGVQSKSPWDFQGEEITDIFPDVCYNMTKYHQVENLHLTVNTYN